jgi:hypothetical protein
VKRFQISCSTDAIAPGAGAAVDATVNAQLLEKCARQFGKNKRELRATFKVVRGKLGRSVWGPVEVRFLASTVHENLK